MVGQLVVGLHNGFYVVAFSGINVESPFYGRMDLLLFHVMERDQSEFDICSIASPDLAFPSSSNSRRENLSSNPLSF